MKSSRPAYSNILRISLLVLFTFNIGLFFQSTAWAQLNYLRNGDKIKVFAPDINASVLKGTIVDISETQLLLNSGLYSYVIPITAIEELQLRTRGKRQTALGLGFGILGGGLLGGGIFAATYQKCDVEGLFACAFHLSRRELFWIGAVVGGVGGAIVGTIIGRNIYSVRWKQVPVDFSVGFYSSNLLNTHSKPVLSVSFSLPKNR